MRRRILSEVECGLVRYDVEKLVRFLRLIEGRSIDLGFDPAAIRRPIVRLIQKKEERIRAWEAERLRRVYGYGSTGNDNP